MTEKIDREALDSDTVRKQILDNRRVFGNYNVARLGELIRRLPGGGRECFETLPILLHTNAPDVPGYVEDPEVPYGIYRFYESGFWKIGKRRLGIEEKTVQSFLLKRYYLRGVYLVGSSGTLSQTDHSDLNYWLLIEQNSASEQQLGLLAEKLDRIKLWAWERYRQRLTFLVLDLDQIQRNDFSGWKEPYVALPRGSFIKEEFYRTFVLIAGQIPYWAVLPVGLSDVDYQRWTEVAGESSDARFMPEDYVDLGILTSVRAEECPAALLSEICRVRQDPVKSLIKASLVAHHRFRLGEEGLLCETVKERIVKPESDGQSRDPWVVSFERAIRFYEDVKEKDGLELIRLCVYLRLAGYPTPRPPDDSDPRRDLLIRFLRKWSWTTDRGDRLEAYADWAEEEKLALEDRILEGLRSLFKRVARVDEGARQTAEIGASDLAALQERVEHLLGSRPGKIPYASAYLRARRDPFSVHVALQKDPAGRDLWAAYDRPNLGPRVDKTSLFADPQLPRVLGWIVLNGLYKTDRTSVVFHHVQSPIVARRAERFLKELHRFFRREDSVNDLGSDPAWKRLLLVLHPGLGPVQGGLASVAFLIQDSWGEIFFLSLDLTHVENNLLRCYEIAKKVCHYRGRDTAGNFAYQIYHARTAEDAQVTKQIEEFIGSFRNDDSGDAV